MAVDVSVSEQAAAFDVAVRDLAAAVPARAKGWRRRVLPVVSGLLVCAVLGWIGLDEARTDTRIDTARSALTTTKARTDRAVAEEATLRRVFDSLRSQLASSTNALASDTAQLEQAEAALTKAQADASDDASYIVDLTSCTQGVQQALNALSVGDQSDALSALDSVAAACQAVDAPDG